MAFIYITEFKGIGLGVSAAHGALPVQAPIAPALAQTRLAIGSTQNVSPAFNSGTRLVHVQCDIACHITIATTPTASSTGGRMAAETERFYTVTPGDKLAVLVTT